MQALVEIINFFSINISLLALLKSGLMGALLGLVIALVLLLSCRGYIYLPRSNRLLQLAKYLYSIIIPVLVITSCAAWFALNNAKQQSLNFIELSQPKIMQLTEASTTRVIEVPLAADKSIEENVDAVINYLKQLAQPPVASYSLTQQFESYLWYATDFSNALLKNKLQQLIAKHLALSDATAGSMMQLRLKDLITKDLASLVLQQQITALYNSLLLKLCLGVGLIFLLILAEIIYANRRQQPAAGAATA